MPNLPINLFDFVLLGVLVGGIIRGRSRATSEQLLGLVKWLTVLFACALVYGPAAQLISKYGVFDPASSCLMAYLGLALLIMLLFSFLKRKADGKFSDREAASGGESYLGMASGLLRFSCVFLVGLSLLHARTFTPAEIKASKKFQVDMFGSDLFPTLPAVQAWVFEESLSGPWIRQDLGFLLIDSTKLDPEPAKERHANLR